MNWRAQLFNTFDTEFTHVRNNRYLNETSLQIMKCFLTMCLFLYFVCVCLPRSLSNFIYFIMVFVTRKAIYQSFFRTKLNEELWFFFRKKLLIFFRLLAQCTI